MSTETIRLIRHGEMGKREIIYLSLRCHHQNENKMGSDETHFNVSVGSNGQSHRTNHNLFEEKG